MTVHIAFSHHSACALWCKRVLIIPRVHFILVKSTQRLVQQLENRLLTPKLDGITACQSQVSTCHGKIRFSLSVTANTLWHMWVSEIGVCETEQSIVTCVSCLHTCVWDSL